MSRGPLCKHAQALAAPAGAARALGWALRHAPCRRPSPGLKTSYNLHPTAMTRDCCSPSHDKGPLRVCSFSMPRAKSIAGGWVHGLCQWAWGGAVRPRSARQVHAGVFRPARRGCASNQGKGGRHPAARQPALAAAPAAFPGGRNHRGEPFACLALLIPGLRACGSKSKLLAPVQSFLGASDLLEPLLVDVGQPPLQHLAVGVEALDAIVLAPDLVLKGGRGAWMSVGVASSRSRAAGAARARARGPRGAPASPSRRASGCPAHG